MSSYRHVLIFLLAIAASRAVFAFPSETDATRDQFIRAGYRVLYFLKYDSRGISITKKNKLNLCRLRVALVPSQIRVQRNEARQFTDRRSSAVDGYTFPWRIYLNEEIWKERLEVVAAPSDSQQDAYRLILKELLRSERSHFSDALQISNELTPFPAEYSLQTPLQKLEHLTEFDNWLDDPGYCLNPGEMKMISATRGTYDRMIENESPLCQYQDLDYRAFEPFEWPSEFMLRQSRAPGCKFIKKTCTIVTETQKFGDLTYLTRSIVRDGEVLFNVPHTLVEPNGERVKILSDFHTNEINVKLTRLMDAGICADNPSYRDRGNWFESSVNPLLPNQPVTLLLTEDPTKFRAIQSLNVASHRLIGKGSRVLLLDTRLKINAKGLQFLKVSVIENSIQQTDGSTFVFSNGIADYTPGGKSERALARSGEIGFISLSDTKFFHYLDVNLREVVRPASR